MPASYFDVDGTLVRTNLIHPTLYYLTTEINPFRSLKMVAKAFAKAPAMILAELQDRRMFNELLYTTFEGMTEDRLRVIAEEIHEEIMMKNLFKGARDLIKRHLDRGDEVVLVSGALDVVLRFFAKEIGATTVIANRLEFKDGRATGKMIRPIIAGPEKALLIRQHAAEKGHDLNLSHAYSDSYSDVPMLSVVGYPTAVCPEPKLRRLALTYQWPILDLDQ